MAWPHKRTLGLQRAGLARAGARHISRLLQQAAVIYDDGLEPIDVIGGAAYAEVARSRAEEVGTCYLHGSGRDEKARAAIQFEDHQ